MRSGGILRNGGEGGDGDVGVVGSLGIRWGGGSMLGWCGKVLER